MTVVFETGYSLPSGDQPLTHARIGHSRNWLSGGTVLASATADGYFANAPMNSLTYERWKPGSVPDTWDYTHPVSATCDYAAIAAHNLVGCAIQISYFSGGTWLVTSPEVNVDSTQPLFFIFTPKTSNKWRLSVISGPAPEIGVIKFGRALQMERPLYGGHAPLNLSRQTVMRANLSETGEYLGRSKWRNYLQTSYNWQNLSAAWVRNNWRDMQLAVETEPFFIAWRPSAYSEVGYVQAMGTPVPANSGTRDLMNVELQVRGLSYE